MKKQAASFLAGVFTALCLLGALVLLLPGLLGWQVLAVASGSMEPFYPTGSLIFVRPVSPREIQVGDCITYDRGGVSVTHRVTDIRPAGYFITRGDANPGQDAPVPFSALVGRAEPFCLPLLGYLVIGIKKGGLWVAGALLFLWIAALVCAGKSFIVKAGQKKILFF